jgi:streptomycin 6-kinase
VRIPRYLATAARDDDRLRDWVAGLPAIVADLTDRWALTVAEPYEPGGQCSWVAPARTADGDDVVLKVGWRHPEAEHEADGLRVWAGDGAVLLHDAHLDGSTSALLLERCTPGTPLGCAVSEPEQDVIVAGLLRRLWQAKPGQEFRPLSDMCRMWAAQFEAATPDGLDPGIARAGVALWRELGENTAHAVVLCTDLHAANILAAQREPWLVVDPKPYVGDPAYDVLQHILNCDDRLAADPAGLAARLAGLLDLDAERVIRWLFARCVVESVGSPLMIDVAKKLAARI